MLDRLATTVRHVRTTKNCTWEVCKQLPTAVKWAGCPRLVATRKPEGKNKASATAVGKRQSVSPWPELEHLEELSQVLGEVQAEGLGRVRVRQHVNPLKQEFMVPVGPLPWEQVFEDPSRPLAVDVGCGSGRFLLTLASRLPAFNLLGLDIRHKLVDRGNEWARLTGRAPRLHFLTANATVSLASLLSTYPGCLSLLTFQFPDPHFKTRHKKRRVVQREVVETAARLLPPSGLVFLQSDVEDAAAAMRDEFEQWGRPFFRVVDPTPSGQLPLADLLPGRPNASSRDRAGASMESGDYHFPPSFSASAAAKLGVATGSGDRLEGDQSTPSGRESGQPVLSLEDRHPCVQAATPSRQQSGSTAEGRSVQTSCQEGTHAGTDTREEAEVQPGGDPGTQLRWSELGWLRDNPLGVPTEREVACLEKGLPIFRLLLERLPSLPAQR